MGKRNNDQAQAMELRGYITVTEAAARLKVTPQAIYAGVQRGELKSTNIGKRQYVEVASLLEYAGPLGRQLYDAAVKEREGEAS